MVQTLAFALRRVLFVAVLALGCVTCPRGTFAQSDPLPSWNEGAVKKSITDFVPIDQPIGS